MQSKGFSLIELLVVVFLLALLLGIGSGFFLTLLETYRQKVAMEGVEKLLTLGRSLANTRNTTIWLCAANEAMTDCAPNKQSHYYANWILKDNNTGAIIHKAERTNFVFYKTNKPEQAIIIKPYSDTSSNTSLLVCTGFQTIEAKALSIGVTGNYRYTSKGTSFKKILKKCNSQN